MERRLTHPGDQSLDSAPTAAGGSRTVPVPAGYRVGRWEVTDVLGDGSWGSVYAGIAATDTPGHADEGGAEIRSVALKFLPADTLTPRQHTALADVVRREVTFSNRACHPHLVRTLEVLTVDDPAKPTVHGCVVLVMERAAGNLSDVIHGWLAGAAAPPEELLAQITAGLAYTHGQGWVHGDLKPTNVLVMPDGRVRLADFGLAAEMDGTHAYAPQLASYDFVPPEWWTEQVSGLGVLVRPSNDVWAFGVIAHQLLSGGLHPFPGRTARSRALAAQSYAGGQAELRLAEQIPSAWRELIRDCLAPDAATRTLDAAALAERVTALAATAPTRPSRGRRRLPLLVGVAAAVLLAAGISGFAIEAYAKSPGRTEAPAPPHSSLARMYTGGALRPDAAVPAKYRPMFAEAKRGCSAEVVTPALMAAIIKVETNFDEKHSNPQTGEYGIANWTPWIFQVHGIDADGNGKADYWSAADAIATMGQYLCWEYAQLYQANLPGDQTLLLAAAWRTSQEKVIAARGVPAGQRTYVQQIERLVNEYSADPGPHVAV